MMDLIDRLWLLTMFCSTNPLDTPACYSFWIAVCAFLAGAGMHLVIYHLWQMWAYRQKWKAAVLAEQQRNAIADDETMSRHRWAGDDQYGETPRRG